MSEVKKCPKCDREMNIGYLSNAQRWTKGKSLWAMPTSKVFAYACQTCGYVELYLERKKRIEGERTDRETEFGGKKRLVRT